jgi:hypothetical protein
MTKGGRDLTTNWGGRELTASHNQHTLWEGADQQAPWTRTLPPTPGGRVPTTAQDDSARHLNLYAC